MINAGAGIEIHGEYVGEAGGTNVRCLACGEVWWPQIKPDSNGRFYRGWRLCPSGCNRQKRKNEAGGDAK